MGDSEVYRKTYILKRGDYDTHGDEVLPGTPKAILPFNNNYPKNRLGLAEWLFNDKNPLTARVYVNQIWQEFFGRGIVKTLGDFGMQGDLPSNPELLDWLAVDFKTHGWNIKRLVKQIVMSATYRQSAVITPEKLKNDPDNILLVPWPALPLACRICQGHGIGQQRLAQQNHWRAERKSLPAAGLMGKCNFGPRAIGKLSGRCMGRIYTAGACTRLIKAHRLRRLKWPFLMPATATSARYSGCAPIPLCRHCEMMNDPTVLEVCAGIGS